MAEKISERIIEDIRARTDIVEIIGAHVTLKKSGSSFKGCCPFHQEKTPSFYVNPIKQFYHCFGCQESGDVFKFLMRQSGQSFNDVLRTLAERAGIVIEEVHDENAQERKLLYALHAELAAFYQRCLNQLKNAAIAREYLKKRGISDDVAKNFGIGFAPAKPRDALLQWGKKNGYTPEQLVVAGILAPPKNTSNPTDFYDRFRGRLIFPISDARGRIVAFSARVLDPKSHPAKYVNSPETLIFTKGRVLYGLDKAAERIVKHPRREAIICEGQIDVIRCHAAGFDTAVASQGTAFSQDHVTLLKRYADCVTLTFDGDNAGRKAALRTGAHFLAAQIPVRVANLPPASDPDSLLRDKGAAFFRELLSDAISITAFQISFLQQMEERPDSIDAVTRVTRGVLEMLATCPSAVLRNHLLQEASGLLNISQSALETDLSNLMEALRQRPGLHVYEPPDDGSEHGGQFEMTNGSELYADDIQATPPLRPPPKHEYLLCEFLIEHEQDQDIMSVVERHLPIDLLTHTFTQSVVSALLTQYHTGSDELAKLQQTTPPEWLPMLEQLLANPQKMLAARDITKEQAIQELIKSAWIARMEEKRGTLPAESTPENDMVRLKLTTHIKHLKTQPWVKIVEKLNPATAQALSADGDVNSLWT